MRKLFASTPGGTISHDGVTYKIEDGTVTVPDNVADVFKASHGFTDWSEKPTDPGVRIVEVEKIVEKVVEKDKPDDTDPNSMPELRIDEMKRGELFAALKAMNVVVLPPITNEELRKRLRDAAHAQAEAAAAAEAAKKAAEQPQG